MSRLFPLIPQLDPAPTSHADNVRSEFKGKVVCLGFNKTGSSSIKRALLDMGFDLSPERPLMSFGYTNLAHWYKNGAFPLFVAPDEISWMFHNEALYQRLSLVSQRASMFGDSPWLYLYQPFDEMYPDTRYILTKRPSTRDVVTSAAKQVMRSSGSAFASISEYLDKKVYRVSFHEYLMLVARGYELHNENVMKFFSASTDRENRLLVLDLKNETDPWTKLGDFLECEVPSANFPVENRAPDSQRNLALPSEFSLDWRNFEFSPWIADFIDKVNELKSSDVAVDPAMKTLSAHYELRIKRFAQA